ncbi:MAG: tRNA (adenosine(37)-N6)-threonylcarbamoyltransferase complex ATPase subunit type 1 TsaE [Cyclobacteriaceae bacterium]
MPKEEWVVKSVGEEDLPSVAKELIDWAQPHTIWLFRGDLGAGKTTFIQALAEQWGVEDRVSSPTFSIVNEYLGGDDQPIYHFDFYRLEDETEALDIGLDEYLTSGNICLMEWPEKIRNLLPDQYVQLRLEVLPDESRTFYASKHE